MIRALFPCTLMILSSSLLSACADGETGTTSGGSLSDSATTSAGAGGAGGAAAGGGGAGQGGQQAGGGGEGGAGGGLVGEVVPKLKSMQMYMDCMPAIEPDPVHGSFKVDYDNSVSKGPSVATITSARLLFGELEGSYKFSVLPEDSGNVAPGVVLEIAHTKKDGSGSGEKPPCDYCSGVWSLEVTWDVNGKSITGTLDPEGVSCVF